MTSPQEHTIEDTLRDLLEIYESNLAELLTLPTEDTIDFATSHLTPGATSAILVHPRNHDALLWGIAKQHLDSSGPTETDILITTTYREPHETLDHLLTTHSRYDRHSGVKPSKAQLNRLKDAAQAIKLLPIRISSTSNSPSTHIVELFETFHTHCPKLVLIEATLIENDTSNYDAYKVIDLLESYSPLAQAHSVAIVFIISTDKDTAKAQFKDAKPSNLSSQIAYVPLQSIPPSASIIGPPVHSHIPLTYASHEKGSAPLAY